MATNAQADSASTADKTAPASQVTADSKQPWLEDLVPAVTDAPKGEVTLGEKAGAFGPGARTMSSTRSRRRSLNGR